MAKAQAKAPTLKEVEEVADEDVGNESAADTLRNIMKSGDEGGGDDVEPEGGENTDSEATANSEGDSDGADETKAAEAETEGDGADKETADPGEDEGADTEGEIEPPSDWSAKEHETFRALPKEAQKMIVERVGTLAEKAGEAAQVTQRFAAIDEILAPRRQVWERDGLSEANVLRQLFAISDFANNDGLGFIQWFAQNKGINLGQLAQPQAGQNGEDPYANDPVVNGLRQELLGLKQQLGQFANTYQQRTAEEQAAQQSQVGSIIERFQNERDESGKLKHPYFDQVRGEVGLYLSNGLESDLEAAYSRACRAHPDVSAKIESARKAQEARDKARQEREKATAAKKTGSSVSGQPGAKTEPTYTGDLRDDLRTDFARAGIA